MTDVHTPGHSVSLVLTVTVNPSVDVSMAVDRLVPDEKMRAHDCRREAGGGGVNVSRVLRRLDVPATSFVVAGGPVGSELVSLMNADGLDVSEFTIPHTTRESVAVTESSTNRQYRVSVPGPSIDDPETLRRRIMLEAETAQIVVLSGGAGPGLPTDFYARIVADLAPSTTTIVDSHGPALAAVTARSATVVKPSQKELAELVGWEPMTADEIERAALEVLDQGTVNAVVASRGPTGALLVSRDQPPLWFRPPPVRPVSTVGAGDSMVGGIAASLARGQDLADAVRFGVAAGTAAVLTPGSELCEPADIARFIDQVALSAATSNPSADPRAGEGLPHPGR